MRVRRGVDIAVWNIVVAGLPAGRAGRRRARVVILAVGNREAGIVAGRSVSGGNIPVALICGRRGSGMLGGIGSGAVPAVTFSIGNLGERNRLSGTVGAGNDAIHGNTAINNCAVVDVVIIDDGGLVKKLVYAIWLGAIITRMTFRKAICGNECETIGAQTKVKAGRHTCAAIEKTHARAIHGERRQRCPSAIFIVGTPRHP